MKKSIIFVFLAVAACGSDKKSNEQRKPILKASKQGFALNNADQRWVVKKGSCNGKQYNPSEFEKYEVQFDKNYTVLFNLEDSHPTLVKCKSATVFSRVVSFLEKTQDKYTEKSTLIAETKKIQCQSHSSGKQIEKIEQLGREQSSLIIEKKEGASTLKATITEHKACDGTAVLTLVKK